MLAHKKAFGRDVEKEEDVRKYCAWVASTRTPACWQLFFDLETRRAIEDQTPRTAKNSDVVFWWHDEDKEVWRATLVEFGFARVSRGAKLETELQSKVAQVIDNKYVQVAKEFLCHLHPPIEPSTFTAWAVVVREQRTQGEVVLEVGAKLVPPGE